MKFDTGFAPNPFWGFLTLACCKPDIRRKAKVGDWIVGLTPKALGNRIVYCMRVDERMTFDDYWSDQRFWQKRPRQGSEVRDRRGDNIYEPLPGDGFRQLPSMHSNGARENEGNKEHDLKGVQVLVSETFAYFGSRALPLPPALTPLIIGVGQVDEKAGSLEVAQNLGTDKFEGIAYCLARMVLSQRMARGKPGDSLTARDIRCLAPRTDSESCGRVVAGSHLRSRSAWQKCSIGN